MPVPIDVEAAEAALLALYAQAQDRIDLEMAMLVHNPQAFRRKARLSEMRQRILRLMDEVDQQALQMIDPTIERIYVTGTSYARAQIASVIAERAGTFTGAADQFNLVSRPAVSKLATGLTDDLLAATRHVRKTTKSMIRQFVKQGVMESVIVGKPAIAAARDVEKFLAKNGIFAVRYRNGAQHNVGEYARMAVRTVSGLAYNEGIFDYSTSSAVEFFEVLDGSGCGFREHDDSDKANGSIRTAELCRSYPLSHPNCRRSFGPRPDVVRRKGQETEFGFEGTPLAKARPIGFQERTKTA